MQGFRAITDSSSLTAGVPIVTRNFSRILLLLSAAIAVTGAAVYAQVSTSSAKPAQPGKVTAPANTARAIFAGGCFWCMEAPFDKLDGVVSTTSGYTAGTKKDPTYKEVSAGWTGHTEAVEIVYDPAKVSYQKLLDVFWHNIDPTTKDAQFCDHGSQYRSGIFYADDAQKAAAEASKAALDKSKPFKGAIVTEVTAATQFYPAEDYHQDYYLKNPLRYKYYRNGCGRDARLTALWGDKAGVGGEGAGGRK
ncbi:MAG: peptide-methionine (S)-S-oxide reductase MsrA [Betaproteobacteria bacterium]|nr:peptide-methionine (S)-S-oxide reductase MsrA [Betaproteobacteria bacterium]